MDQKSLADSVRCAIISLFLFSLVSKLPAGGTNGEIQLHHERDAREVTAGNRSGRENSFDAVVSVWHVLALGD